MTVIRGIEILGCKKEEHPTIPIRVDLKEPESIGRDVINLYPACDSPGVDGILSVNLNVRGIGTTIVDGLEIGNFLVRCTEVRCRFNSNYQENLFS